MSDALLEVDRVSVRYHGRAVGADQVSLTVSSGEIVALVGANGAGKTSTLRAIAGFLPRDPGRISGGTVSFRGAVISGESPSKVSRRGVAFVPEQAKVFASLTVEEHLKLAAPGRSGRALAEAKEAAVGIFPGLARHMGHPAGYLSGGERQMLAIATALCSKPTLLLVDELSQGLAPSVAASIASELVSIRSSDTALLLVEQNARLAAQVADRMYVLETGRVTAHGTPEELSGSTEMARAYLGVVLTHEASDSPT